MKTLKNMTGDSLEQMIDYKVVDQNGDSIGTLHSLWSDPTTGAVEFLGVKTGWIFGSNHVVPAEKAELDEDGSVVRLPYTEAFIKEAPAISAEAEISEAEEANIYQYYGLDRTGGVVDAPGNNQAGVNYSRPASAEPAEALGSASIANASEAGMGGTQFGGPTSTDAGATDTGVSRLRRTSRPDSAFQSNPGTSTAGTAGSSSAGTAGSSALSDIGPTDNSSRPSATGTAPGNYSTSNMFGSTGSSIAPVAADSAGASGSDLAAGASDALADRFGSNVTDPGDENAGLTRGGDANRDPITGEPGSHPVGTGAGALAAGAAGAAIGGVVGGPIGAPVGAIIGAVAGAVGGGYAGKGIAETVNPTDEEAYWQANHQNAAYRESDTEYSDYSPAYKVGYEGYGRYADSGKSYSEVENELEQDYNRSRGTSKLTWDKAKLATRDAWERLKNKASDATK